MDKTQIIELLNLDLQNEWKHLRFYLYHASAVTGLHCEEYKELFLKEAASEMIHITAFSDLIIGLGGISTSESNSFEKFTDPKEILQYALNMERQVVANYVERIKHAEQMNNPEDIIDARWLVIFLEGQIQDSREDVDHFNQILKGL